MPTEEFSINFSTFHHQLERNIRCALSASKYGISGGVDREKGTA